MSTQLRQAYLSVLITLVAQFLLGMATNLFVTVPLHHPGADPPEYFTGVAQSVFWAITNEPIWLVLHALLGLALVLFGFRLLIPAIRSRHRPTIVTSVLGAIAMLGAGFNGGSYLNYHEDFSSMIMASFFAMAITSYVVGLWALPPQQESRSWDAR